MGDPFKARIERTEKQVVDLTNEFELLGSKDFLEIAENPLAFKADALRFMTDEKASETQRLIAALSMQRLPLTEFVRFCDEVLELRKRGQIAHQVFSRAIFPGYEWNTQLDENFRRPEVRAILSKIRSSGVFPEDSQNKGLDNKHIDDILSGKTAKYIQELRAAGELN